MNCALLFALNDNFVLSMKVFLLSLLETNPHFNYDILLLSDGNLSKKSVTDLKRIYPKIKSIDAKKDDYTSCLPTLQEWGYNLYYRFDVFEMGNLGYDRIIIMDSDMVVLKNINDLFKYDQDFAACQKHLGIPEIAPNDPVLKDRKRFNCGLMSISKNLLRPFYKAKLIKIASGKSWSSDQPVFNICFEKIAYYLPQKFNVVSSIASGEALAGASIIQYHGFVKPWHSNIPEKCFESFVIDELGKFTPNITDATAVLKQIFDSYAKQCVSYT